MKDLNATNWNVFTLLEGVFICGPAETDSMFMACRYLGQTWAELFITNIEKGGVIQFELFSKGTIKLPANELVFVYPCVTCNACLQ